VERRDDELIREGHQWLHNNADLFPEYFEDWGLSWRNSVVQWCDSSSQGVKHFCLNRIEVVRVSLTAYHRLVQSCRYSFGSDIGWCVLSFILPYVSNRAVWYMSWVLGSSRYSPLVRRCDSYRYAVTSFPSVLCVNLNDYCDVCM
jgi:hypothetical protein